MSEPNPSPSKTLKRTIVNTSHKVMDRLTHAMHTIFSCYTGHLNLKKNFIQKKEVLVENCANVLQTVTFLQLPNEMLCSVMEFCDFNTLSNVREVNRRFFDVIYSMGDRLPKKQIVGGIEILPSNYPEKITLKRIKEEKCITLHRTKLHILMSRISVCHRLSVTSIDVDDFLLDSLFLSSYRSMECLVLDTLADVDTNSVSKFVNKVSPSFVLHLNAPNSAFRLTINPQLVVNSCARFTTIDDHICASQLDDDFLVSLVTSDTLLKKQVILPVTAISHCGISTAVHAFHTQCLDIRNEAMVFDYTPVMQFVIYITGSETIDVNSIKDQCCIWKNPAPNRNFSVEVRVDFMNLLLHVVYPCGTPLP